MIKTLKPFGDQLGLILERSVLEALGIDRETPLDVTIEGRSLVIRPTETCRELGVLEAAERVMNIHDQILIRSRNAVQSSDVISLVELCSPARSLASSSWRSVRRWASRMSSRRYSLTVL